MLDIRMLFFCSWLGMIARKNTLVHQVSEIGYMVVKVVLVVVVVVVVEFLAAVFGVYVSEGSRLT